MTLELGDDSDCTIFTISMSIKNSDRGVLVDSKLFDLAAFETYKDVKGIKLE